MGAIRGVGPTSPTILVGFKYTTSLVGDQATA
jgi:hypothetical protein